MDTLTIWSVTQTDNQLPIDRFSVPFECRSLSNECKRLPVRDEKVKITSRQKTPLTVADLLKGRVLAFFEEHKIASLRMLTDRSTKYCGNPEHH